MTEAVDVVVIGAGVVGLAVARELARCGREVVVLEAAAGIGEGQSSRNSEVVHAGLYYPPGSLKARLCVDGRRQLYDYCADRGVPFRQCGKLVVATEDAQLDALVALRRNAEANGVEGLGLLSAGEVAQLEPDVRCVAALHSAATGIVDSHALMLALKQDAEDRGAHVLLEAPVIRGCADARGITLEVGGRQADEVVAQSVVNCAGLGAPAMFEAIAGGERGVGPRLYPCKGNYFSLKTPPPFARLIYPIPDEHSLGVHLTLDLAGRARFGPDKEWVPDGVPWDYEVDPARQADFEAAIRRWWPTLPADALAPAFAGIRARVSAPDEPLRDFGVIGPDVHGQAGVVHLVGIESPGLTASLALASEVAARLV